MVISNMQVRKVCQVSGCGGVTLAKGYCCKHYYQIKRHGAVGASPRRRVSHGGSLGGVDRERSRRWLAGLGDTLGSERPTGALAHCTVRGCAGSTFDQRLCRLHYIKMRHLGLSGAVEAAGEIEAEREDPWAWMEEAVKD